MDVGIIMGSGSDSRVMKEAARVLDEFGIDHEDMVVSAHRTPERLSEYARHAEDAGIRVIIAGAGGAAHLPGMVASFTHIPVVGVPILAYSDKGGPAGGASAFGGWTPCCRYRRCRQARRWGRSASTRPPTPHSTRQRSWLSARRSCAGNSRTTRKRGAKAWPPNRTG